MGIKMKNPFKRLTKFELWLWICSVCVVFVSSLLSPEFDPLSLIASLVGVSALIFLARGDITGQVLVIIFAVLYAIVSYKQAYYGEMITYLAMTAPMAVFSIISWMRNPFGDTGEVRVNRLTGKKILLVLLVTAAVTVAFYFLLELLDNESLLISTLSVATSFFAAALTFLRSPLYAVGYALNDIVLIVLWLIAAQNDPTAYSVVACFSAFLVNDLYGFVSWRRMKLRQAAEERY